MNPEKREKEKQVLLTEQPTGFLTLHTGDPSSLQSHCGWPLVRGKGVIPKGWGTWEPMLKAGSLKGEATALRCSVCSSWSPPLPGCLTHASYTYWIQCLPPFESTSYSTERLRDASPSTLEASVFWLWGHCFSVRPLNNPARNKPQIFPPRLSE